MAKLKALLIALEVREIDDLMTKTYEYFSTLGEVIKDNIVERDIEIMTLQDEREKLIQAIKHHRDVVWAGGPVGHPEDKELYKKLLEVEKCQKSKR